MATGGIVVDEVGGWGRAPFHIPPSTDEKGCMGGGSKYVSVGEGGAQVVRKLALRTRSPHPKRHLY
jgi:hypothetical protein